jgi:hypothetical protein
MTNLFDFGADGTLNGLPDGNVPITTNKADCQYEVFLMGTGTGVNGPQSVLIYEKQLNDYGIYPHRYASVRIELNTGVITFHVRHALSGTMVWEGHRVITRQPHVLARNVTEFVASTKASLPYNQTSNPLGIREDASVRVVVGTSIEDRSSGKAELLHHLDQYNVSPRNR